MEEILVKLRTAGLTVAILILGLCGCHSEVRDSSSPISDSVTSLTGDFKVFYQIQETETHGAGSGSEGLKVTSIHFHDSYIVLMNGSGRGWVLSIAKLNYLTWE